MQHLNVSSGAWPATPASKAGMGQNAAAGGSYTPSQVTQIINAHGGFKAINWRFDLLHSDLSYKGDITPYVVSAQINHDTTQAVHRTMRLMMADTAASQTVTIEGNTVVEAGIDYNQDRVQPWCLLGVPGSSDWLHYALGVFLFSAPAVTMAGYALERDAQMSDLTYIVSKAQALSNSIGAPFALPAGVALIDIVYHLLTNSPTAAGGSAYAIPTATPTLTNIPGLGIATSRVGTADHPWPNNTVINAQSAANYTFSEGTPYLDMINQMLFWSSCENLWCDESGNYCTDVRPFNGNYNSYSTTYTYDSTVDSIIDYGGTETFNLDQMANVVQVVVEDPSRDTFYASATNTSSTSPISLPNRGYAIVNTVRDSGVPTATATNWAQNYANILLQEGAFLTDTVSLPTSVNPAHQNKDVIALNIYQQFVAAGSVQNWPIIVGGSTPNTTQAFAIPGLTVTEKFVEIGFSIDIQSVLPGQARASGGSGLTVGLEPQHSKQGSKMTHTLQRVTSLT